MSVPGPDADFTMDDLALKIKSMKLTDDEIRLEVRRKFDEMDVTDHGTDTPSSSDNGGDELANDSALDGVANHSGAGGVGGGGGSSGGGSGIDDGGDFGTTVAKEEGGRGAGGEGEREGKEVEAGGESKKKHIPPWTASSEAGAAAGAGAGAGRRPWFRMRIMIINDPVSGKRCAYVREFDITQMKHVQEQLQKKEAAVTAANHRLMKQVVPYKHTHIHTYIHTVYMHA